MAEDTYSITIKTPKDKIDISVSSGMLIKKVKEKASEKFKATIEQLVLIYSGKILKDTETLKSYQIKSGHVVHLVIKTAPKTTQPPPSSESTPVAASTTPSSNTSQPATNNSDTPPLGLGLMDGLGASLGSMGSGNFMEMQQQVQREMMSNPELLQQIMENPFVQNMMSNPEILQQLMTNNPQMQQLMERNPEITHMLNNPQLMRQTMELARNPAMLQEMMRNQDRAMSNLESIPGGYNALRRMYTDIQEPMMNAAQDQFGQNPFAALVGDNGSGEQGNTNTENTEPLPNPWGTASGRSTGAPQTATASSKSSTTATPPGGNPAAGSMFNTPAMQNLMQQITDNPSMMQNMMSAPYMQSMMRSMAENPDLANQIFSHNPLFANNPQMREMMPAMLQQMQSPEMQNLFTNPRAMEAMMQIQQGMQTLQTEAPGVVPGLSNPFGATPQPSSTATSTTTTPPSSNSTPAPSASQQALLAQMMQTLSAGGVARPQEPPETRYRPQLEQLTAMGFINREANIRALVSTNGNVNAAIELLLRALN